MQTQHPETRKPAFVWLGLNGKPDNGTGLSESKKRVFGTDLTNTAAKRFKIEVNAHQMRKPLNAVRVKQEIETEDERMRVAGKSYQFGPFAPASVPRIGNSQDDGKQAVDWESLASTYRPQYHNQGTDLHNSSNQTK